MSESMILQKKTVFENL